MELTRDQIVEKVDEVFENAETQADYIMGLYGLLFNLDGVAKIEGFPRVGKKLSDYLWKRAMEFDRRLREETGENFMIGGAWMNHGWSEDQELGPWEISVEGVKIIKRKGGE